MDQQKAAIEVMDDAVAINQAGQEAFNRTHPVPLAARSLPVVWQRAPF